LDWIYAALRLQSDDEVGAYAFGRLYVDAAALGRDYFFADAQA